MRALILHGTMGRPEGNWFPWVKKALEQRGWAVDIPTLPTPEGQSYTQWKNALRAFEYDLIIGHSCGGSFALRLLQDNLIHPAQLILVCPVAGKIGNAEYDTLNESFITPAFDWAKIKKAPTKITLLSGDNDPYVPIQQPQKIAHELDIPLHLIPDGGHLNEESGFKSFPDLLDYIHE